MRTQLGAAGVLGASAVALGAYAAHGLDAGLADLGFEGEELAKRVDNFVTGARYQLASAAAVLALALGASGRVLLVRAGWLLVAGTLVFSGLLYALAFAGEGWRWLGAVVPLGGLAMIAAWSLVAVAAFTRLAAPEREPQQDLGRELIRLEEVITHQQQLVQDLNETLTEVRRDADAAGPKLAAVEQTVRRLVELQQAAEDLPDERPPHY